MTAIARRPSMSARYRVTSAPHERATESRCGSMLSPSQKDTGRTGRLSQKEQEARGALLAKRVFVENQSSKIQSPTGRRCQRSALQYPVQHRRTRERRSAMVTAALRPNPRVANADTVDRADVPEMPGLAGGSAWPRKTKGKIGKLTTPTRPTTCCAGSAPILLHGHSGRLAPNNC